MCGIHGFFDRSLSAGEAHQLIGNMVRATQHRGPDSNHTLQINAVSFGHNRLSIIDLSAQADQPMVSQQLTIVFNGEIYNYKELRTELKQLGHHFETDGDTEVILESFREWGESCVSRFLGMWAFAIWDNEKEELFCSRDRFGIKPFYFLHAEKRFYFASEVKALRHSPIFSKTLNLNQVSRALQLGWINYQNETFYESVHVLEPGHNLILKNGRKRLVQYWKIEQQPKFTTTDTATLVGEFKSLFENSLDLHLRSDVPLAATLSGGIDSSSIVSSLISNQKVQDLNTFSIFYEGSNAVDERPFIEEVRNAYPGKFNSFYYSPKEAEIMDSYHDIVDKSDFPLLASSPISHYFVMKLVAQHGIKVVLSGQGADDYLGGYMHTYYRFYAEKARAFRLKTLFTEFNLQRKRQEFGAGKMADIVLKSGLSFFLGESALYNLEYKKYFPFVVDIPKNQALDFRNEPFGKVDSFHHFLMNYSSLPGILHYDDRFSMAHSIETRVPFLDHRLVEFGFRLPTDLKIHDGYTKWILREAMQDVIPPKIRFRTDKKGFVTPGEVLWLRGSLKHLLDIDYSNLPFLHEKLVRQEIENFKKGDNRHANLIWRIANLNYWIKHFA
jgi:asparagine synthase (glutamine-hydrolysing)